MTKIKSGGLERPEDKSDISDLCSPLGARKRPKARRGQRRKDTAEYYDFATAILGIEVFESLDEDPFDDWSARDCARLTRAATAARKKLVSHASAHFLRQHRHSFFQIILVDSIARFIRWDRAGAVVSSRFMYAREPELLTGFFWRFAHLDGAQQGWDPTASPATRKEADLFTRVFQQFLNDMEAGTKDGRLIRKLPNADETQDGSGGYPTWKIHVANEAVGKTTDLLVRRPHAGERSFIGRATRGYVAYDLQDERFVFLKDSWRRKEADGPSEFDMYQELYRNHVPFVPDILYGGDVRNADGEPQQTLNDLVPEGGISKGYVHNRIVQDIYYRLSSAQTERELVQAVHDVFVGK